VVCSFDDTQSSVSLQGDVDSRNGFRISSALFDRFFSSVLQSRKKRNEAHVVTRSTWFFTFIFIECLRVVMGTCKVASEENLATSSEVLSEFQHLINCDKRTIRVVRANLAQDGLTFLLSTTEPGLVDQG